MKSIFKYSDYRDFLQDYYKERKKQNRSYSFRFFSRKAGLESPNYYKLVMDGDRNLTHRNVRKFAKGLGLGEREAVYFENLVFSNQAKDIEEARFFEKNLKMIRAQDDRVLLTRDQYEVLSKWYPLVIKELALLEKFYAKPKWIAARLDYRISPEQAKEAVKLLERLKLIKVNPKTQRIRVAHQSMQTPNVTHSNAVIKYYEQIFDLTKDAVKQQSSKDRCFSSLIVAVRKEDLAEAFRRIHEFRNELDTYFGRSKKYNSVYQLGIQLFRLDSDV